MKRAISLILAIVICMTLTTESKAKGYIVNGTHVNVQKSEFDGILEIGEKRYGIETEQGEIIETGRLDIDLLNTLEYEEALDRNDIPEEVKDALRDKREKAVKSGYDSARVTIFSPDLINEEGISAYGESTSYYTYNGHSMKSVQLYSTGISTGWEYIKSGKSTKDTANNLISVILTGVGLSNKTLSFVAAGLSALQIFYNQYSSAIINGHTNDYLQVRLIYDDVDQWTYGKSGDIWKLGLITAKATITKIGIEQYYYDSAVSKGRTATSDRYVNLIHKSPHFDSPWATAWSNLGYVQNETI